MRTTTKTTRAITPREVRLLLFAALVIPTILALAPALVAAPTVPTDIKQPGTQPGEVAVFTSPDNCDNCHGNVTQPVNPGQERDREPGFGWRGGMMGNASRDPLFWATVAVAVQDFIPDADPNLRGGVGDLCIRFTESEAAVYDERAARAVL